MEIALVLQHVDPSKGGAETYVADLGRRLAAEGHEVFLYAETWDDAALPSEVRGVRVPVRGRSRAGRVWDFARSSEIALQRSKHDCTVGFINTWHQDILIPQGGVHEASLQANAMRYRAGLVRETYKLGKRINPKWWLLHHAIERRQYDSTRPTRFVAVSEMVREHLERFHAVPRERVRVIPNAIDAGRLTVTDRDAVRKAFRDRLGLGESELIGLFVGHNFRLKGLPPLLRTWKQRCDRSPEARPIHLAVCGGGKLAPMRRLVADLGLGATVHLVGFVPEIKACYHGCDFFVSPTYYDPCSLVVFEALACGLPVITTRCNGASEVMTEGREGFVIDQPDDITGLTRALDRMADDRARMAMASAAVRLGAEQSFDRHVTRLVALCEEVAETKRRAGSGTLSGKGRLPETRPILSAPSVSTVDRQARRLM